MRCLRHTAPTWWRAEFTLGNSCLISLVLALRARLKSDHVPCVWSISMLKYRDKNHSDEMHSVYCCCLSSNISPWCILYCIIYYTSQQGAVILSCRYAELSESRVAKNAIDRCSFAGYDSGENSHAFFFVTRVFAWIYSEVYTAA